LKESCILQLQALSFIAEAKSHGHVQVIHVLAFSIIFFISTGMLLRANIVPIATGQHEFSFFTQYFAASSTKPFIFNDDSTSTGQNELFIALKPFVSFKSI